MERDEAQRKDDEENRDKRYDYDRNNTYCTRIIASTAWVLECGSLARSVGYTVDSSNSKQLLLATPSSQGCSMAVVSAFTFWSPCHYSNSVSNRD